MLQNLSSAAVVIGALRVKPEFIYERALPVCQHDSLLALSMWHVQSDKSFNNVTKQNVLTH